MISGSKKHNRQTLKEIGRHRSNAAPRERNYFGAALAVTGCDRAATASLICRFELCPDLLRIQAECFELSAPFGGSIAKTLDTNTSG